MAKFKIGDIVQRGCVQYKITGWDGDDYVAVDTLRLEHGLKSHITKISMYDDECELIKEAELNVQPFVPKFKVGDIIVCKDDGLIYGIRYVITEIKQDRYIAIPHHYEIEPKEDKVIPFNDENKWVYPLEVTELENKVLKPKFKVGDKVKRKVVDPHNPATKFVYTVIEIDDDIYHKYCLDHNDHESWIPISAQDELELVEEPKSKLKLGVDLNEIPYIDTIWKDTLAKLIGDITERNTAAFIWLIDETLKFMDCGAYEEMACRGMRQFAKELKKRLGHD